MTAKRPAAAGKRARKRKESEPVAEEEEEYEAGEAEEATDDPVVEPDSKTSKKKSSHKSLKPPAKADSRGQFLVAGSEAAASSFVQALEQIKDGALLQARFQDSAGKLAGKCLLEAAAVQDLGGHAVAEGRLLARTGTVPKQVKQLRKDADTLVHLCRFSRSCPTSAGFISRRGDRWNWIRLLRTGCLLQHAWPGASAAEGARRPSLG
jgi:hypothetical protein